MSRVKEGASFDQADSRAKFGEIYVDHYSKRFSKKWLNQLLDLFASPLGDKYAKAQRDLKERLAREAKKYDRESS